MSEPVIIPHQRRQGRTLAAEPAFRKALDEGKRVYTGGPKLNGVWFAVSLDADDNIVYTALERPPEDV